LEILLSKLPFRKYVKLFEHKTDADKIDKFLINSYSIFNTFSRIMNDSRITTIAIIQCLEDKLPIELIGEISSFISPLYKEQCRYIKFPKKIIK